MTDSERIAYLLDKLAACERDNAATIADLRKQVDGWEAMHQRVSRWWTEEKDAHATTRAKLAALEGADK
jgi:hypothetical protein